MPGFTLFPRPGNHASLPLSNRTPSLISRTVSAIVYKIMSILPRAARRFDGFPANSLPGPLAGKVFPCHFQRENRRKTLITKAVFCALHVLLGLRGDFSRKLPRGRESRAASVKGRSGFGAALCAMGQPISCASGRLAASGRRPAR